MRQTGYTATRARTRRAWQKSVSPTKGFIERRWQNMAQREPHEVVYNVSRTFFTVIMVLLIVCTVIDILPQSFSSGQFWNAIIVIVAMSIIVVWAVLLHLIRRVTVNRWLAALPRSHQIGRRDVGKKLKNRIVGAQRRCEELFLNQQDFTKVEHPGLQNPQMSGRLAGVLDIGVPFWEIADMLPIFVEDYCTLLIPEFNRPAGASLREYLEMAMRGDLLFPDAKTHVERFLLLYENLRYSGRNLSQDTLLELMRAFSNVLNRFHDEAGPLTGVGSSIAVNRGDNDDEEEEEDGGFISLVPSEAVASQSSYSSSVDSVRIHPIATQDSWISHASRDSSSVSRPGHFLRDRLRHRGSSLLSILAFDSEEPVPGMPNRPTIMEDHENHLLPPPPRTYDA